MISLFKKKITIHDAILFSYPFLNNFFKNFATYLIFKIAHFFGSTNEATYKRSNYKRTDMLKLSELIMDRYIVYCIVILLQAFYINTKYFDFIKNQIFLAVLSFLHMIFFIYIQFCFYFYSVIFYIFTIKIKVFFSCIPIFIMLLCNPLPTFIYTMIFSFINFDFGMWWNSEITFLGIDTLFNYYINSFFFLYNLFVSLSILLFIFSIPLFFVFYFFIQPLKQEKNILMLKREVLLAIPLINCLIIFWLEGQLISLIYLVLLKIDHHVTSKVLDKLVQSLNNWYVIVIY